MVSVAWIMAKRRRGVKWFAGAVFLLVALGIGWLWPWGHDVVRREFAVPIRIGDRVVRSALMISCDVENIDAGFGTLRKWRASADERRLGAVVRAVNAGDSEAMKALSKPAAAGMTIEDTCSMMKSHFELIGILPDLSNFKIRRRIYWGDDSFFTYTVDNPDLPHTGMLGFERETGKGLLFSPALGGDIESVLSMALRASSGSLAPYESGRTASREYRFRVDDGGGENPVDLLFNGRVCDITLPGDVPDASDVVLSFYAQVITALTNAGSIEAFRDIGNRYYEGHSKDRFLAWMERGYEDVVRWRNEYVGGKRKVVFVLDADLVFVIFYHLRGRSDWDIQHDYAVREGASLYVTRLAISDELSRFFGSRRRFIGPFLMMNIGYRTGSAVAD